ncbi:hypothetical protein, partial [Streptomyces sp. NBC_00887]|uniref:hypothetical protein n=1 Tax=Streptomyces sp. NBC_00887 TaxID=2975859 RepID=UPI003863DD8F
QRCALGAQRRASPGAVTFRHQAAARAWSASGRESPPLRSVSRLAWLRQARPHPLLREGCEGVSRPDGPSAPLPDRTGSAGLAGRRVAGVV